MPTCIRIIKEKRKPTHITSYLTQSCTKGKKKECTCSAAHCVSVVVEWKSYCDSHHIEEVNHNLVDIITNKGSFLHRVSCWNRIRDILDLRSRVINIQSPQLKKASS